MPNYKKDLNITMSAQQTLFATKFSEGELDVSMPFRDSLSRAMRKQDVSRYHLAATISELSGRNITKDMLDKCTSSNLDYGLRAEQLTAVCYALKTVNPITVLLTPLNHGVISPEESDFLEIAKLQKQRDELDAKIVQLKHRNGMK